MATHHGKNGRVKIGSTLVASTTKWALSEQVAVADNTGQGDSWGTHLTGIPRWSGSVEGWYDPADSGQGSVLTIGGSLSLGLYSDGTGSGSTYFTGTASITQINRETPIGDTVSFSVTIEGNGALAKQTVSA